ncbi:RNA methylase [Leptolyngbya boryana NIES-2135]|jgi:putative N6-adenine-specific DNA methylase|uniref:RNA methylase n=2 Tax=Leptolyngbya TaxID=47251 RepID=A0A1Z4JE68_LEPBY|nr:MULTISPECIES: THUMP domain-containing protein [Leptolyngbya]MCY6491243.1 THUMP domain-containing protein [Leptolyngbya sp. GGD]BAY55020.1 RNA methylase [Leptolyngbya boryana NIES-2135]MBD2366000.1 RNA methyltransferase [Leptolyngbya sp. FACHB-161]MBD2372180.1 RNA methyltransferase [Leptolyngbya sp. FACHB-238]MBD2396603.1 RNA methyltransferase [Leptolyngbya sp. FACHB-239]
MNQYFATVARGLESLAAQELEQLGAKTIEPGFCGVSFTGDRDLLYRVNLWARLPFRILMKLHEFPCQDSEDLYRGVQSIDWSLYLTPDMTLAVKATGKNQQLNHTHFTALQVKNAIVDQQQDRFSDRSNVELQSPDVQVTVHIDRDLCTVSLDSSGESLHRRGYRPAVGAAPLKESLAAALIQLSGWQPEQMFYDPLCGSGTLPLEASLKALNVAPGLFRERFGFETWLDADLNLLDELIKAAEASQRESLPAPIWGSDRNPEVIEQAIVNATNCGVSNHVYFSTIELEDVAAPADSGVLFCNPPYGERLGRDSDLGAFYKRLGNVLKQRFKGWTAFVLSGNKELAQSIGLRSSQRFAVYNGALPCQLMKYELY